MNFDPTTTTYVYRHNHPAGYKGRVCRMLTPGILTKDSIGRVQINVGHELVTVEFEDNGERFATPKQAIIPAASKLGRVFIRNARRGT